MKKPILFAKDVDNTLLDNRLAWCELIHLASRELYGPRHSFRMLWNPDGTRDVTFSQLSTQEFWVQRLGQVGLDPAQEDSAAFFARLDKLSLRFDYRRTAKPYWQIGKYLEATRGSSSFPLTILTSGTRGMQTKVLTDLGLAHLFDLKHSRFKGESDTKTDGFADIVAHFRPDRAIYTGDARSDMRAAKEAEIECQSMAIGFTGGKLSTTIELRRNGADYVIPRYTNAHIAGALARACA